MNTYTWAHFRNCIENTVHDDEEREDGFQWIQSATNDEPHERPENETQSHRLFASNLVHEVTAKKATRQVEAVENSSIPNGLHKTVAGVESRQNGRAE